jgi:glycosyltransferase involved in cell wall biosynthesis
MPTFKQGSFLVRAIESILAQSLKDWELIVLDDGSPDDTKYLVQQYLSDTRISYFRNEQNLGLGATLNIATALARGRLISYLPSDDTFYADHLEALSTTLDGDDDIYLAYGGVRVGFNEVPLSENDGCEFPTLLGPEFVDKEVLALSARKAVEWDDSFKSGNLLALVQVMHRRTLDPNVVWAPRSEVVSDALEADHWRSLLSRGLKFRYAGKTTCEWAQHPDQRHRIIAGRLGTYGRIEGGLSLYRSHYGIPQGEYLNWQPAEGYPVDERRRYARFERPYASRAEGLRILLVGELGFNPERMLALEERGHQLAGIWVTQPESWDAVGPFPWGRILDIRFASGWEDEVRRFKPDIIYALLNWQALPLIDAVLDAGLNTPLVFHFKESFQFAYRFGLWPILHRLMLRSQGQIFISDENRQWFSIATAGEVGVDPSTYMILDGDLPKEEWFGTEFSPKLGATDGEIHTVCAGRWMFNNAWDEFARERIHVHVYGDVIHKTTLEQYRAGLENGYLHLHPAISPQDWVSELSQYSAGWLHVFKSHNHGDLRRADWNDLNLPARLSTYSAAGLPWILRDNSGMGCLTAMESLGARYDVSVPFISMSDLGAKLRDGGRLQQQSENMIRNRSEFAFDTHCDRLIEFFRAVSETCS